MKALALASVVVLSLCGLPTARQTLAGNVTVTLVRWPFT